MKMILVICLLVFLSYCRPVDDRVPVKIMKSHTQFPKILWTYWSSDLRNAPIFTIICINNLIHYAEVSGWQFRFVTPNNLTDFMSSESQKYLKKITETLNIPIQNIVDTYKCFLLHDNGGMWVDTTTMFVRDLNWIETIDNDKRVYNKIRDDPQMIIFTSNLHYGGNRTTIFDEQLQQEIVFYPGMEYWALISKPGALFLKELIQEMYYSTTILHSMKRYSQMNNNAGYQYRRQISSYFFFANYMFQTMYQKKQAEIDRNPKDFKEKYAIDYYRQWCFDSFETGLALFEQHQWTVGNVMRGFFYETLEQLDKKDILFIKFSGAYYPPFTAFLDQAETFICLGSVKPIPSNSIASKYGFEHSSNIETVQKIQNLTISIAKGSPLQCKLFNQNISSIFFIAGFQYFALIVFVSIISFFCLIKGRKESSDTEAQEVLQNSAVN